MTEQHWSIPVEGYYKRRLVRGGPFVPVHIARFCTCSIHGEENHVRHVWKDDCDRYPPVAALISGTMLDDAEKHWTYCMGNPIAIDEYQYMLDLKGWAEKNAPEDPMANPDKKIELNKIPSLF